MKLEMILATVDPTYNDQCITDQCVVLQTTHKFNPLHLLLAARHALDKTPEWEHARQLIPYIVVQNNEGKYLVYSRTEHSGDERLHGSLSIGWGGHIDLADCVMQDSDILVNDTIFDSALRELNEELGITRENLEVHTCTAEEVGQHYYTLILSDEDSVGRVHLGLAYTVVVTDDTQFQVENTGKIVGWHTLEEIENMGEALEGWTRKLTQYMKQNKLNHIL